METATNTNNEGRPRRAAEAKRQIGIYSKYHAGRQ